jgi:hypothetical protein
MRCWGREKDTGQSAAVSDSDLGEQSRDRAGPMGQTATKRGVLGGTLLVGFIQRQNGALTARRTVGLDQERSTNASDRFLPCMFNTFAMGRHLKRTNKRTSAVQVPHLVPIEEGDRVRGNSDSPPLPAADGPSR